MVILRVCTIYFFSHLPLRDFFSTPPITFLMVRPSVLRVKSWLLAPLLGRSHVLLNHHSMAPVYRHFVKCTALRGLRAVKSELNPGFGRVKPRLCPGVSIDWYINDYTIANRKEGKGEQDSFDTHTPSFEHSSATNPAWQFQSDCRQSSNQPHLSSMASGHLEFTRAC